MNLSRLPLLCLAVLSLTSAALGDTLTIGSKAPDLSVLAWVKQDPISKIAPGKIYVVEFWATWCGPCRQSVPHLTELAKKYAGKVVVAGISTMEDQKNDADTSYLALVKHYVKRMGDKMDYHVGVDGPKHAMATHWLDAAGEGGLPTAFIVGKNGKIAWIGSPLMGLDEALDQVVSGKYDVAAALEQRKKEKGAVNAAGEPGLPSPKRSPMDDLVKAIQKKDWKTAVTTCDQILASSPDNEQTLGPIKFMAMLQTDQPGAYAYAKKLEAGLYKDHAPGLATLSEIILSDEFGPKKPDTALALHFAQAAANAAQGQSPSIYDALANAKFNAGDVDGALEAEAKAFQLMKTVTLPKDSLDRLQSQMKNHQAIFEAAKARRNR
jgi:thiol-disulfide isomerase/thioredoxin